MDYKTLIIDTNIVFSALAKKSTVRDILIDCPFRLYAPETIITEIRKYESLILQKSGLLKEEFEILFALIIKDIEIVEKEKYHEFITDAK